MKVVRGMELVELIKKCRDTEEYSEEKLSAEKLLSLLEVVRWTPSAANIQPWEVYIIDDQQLREELDGCLLDPLLRDSEKGNTISSAPAVIVMALDRKRARARFGSQGEEFYALQDTAAAVNNIRLKAAREGIGSTWHREVKLNKVAEVLKLSALIKPVALLTLGYPIRRMEFPPPLFLNQLVHVIQ